MDREEVNHVNLALNEILATRVRSYLSLCLKYSYAFLLSSLNLSRHHYAHISLLYSLSGGGSLLGTPGLHVAN